MPMTTVSTWTVSLSTAKHYVQHGLPSKKCLNTLKITYPRSHTSPIPMTHSTSGHQATLNSEKCKIDGRRNTCPAIEKLRIICPSCLMFVLIYIKVTNDNRLMMHGVINMTEEERIFDTNFWKKFILL